VLEEGLSLPKRQLWILEPTESRSSRCFVDEDIKTIKITGWLRKERTVIQCEQENLTSCEAVTCPREYGRPVSWDADERPEYVYAIGARSLCAEM